MDAKKIITIHIVIIVIIATIICFGTIRYKNEIRDYETAVEEYENRTVVIEGRYRELQEENNRLIQLTGRQQRELGELEDKLGRAKELAVEIGTGLEGDGDIVQRAVETLSGTIELIQLIIEDY